MDWNYFRSWNPYEWTPYQPLNQSPSISSSFLIQAGHDLVKDKPHLAEQIQPTLSSVENKWEKLEVASKDKGEKLFDANRGTLYQQSIEDVDSWVAELESQMVQAETVQVFWRFVFRTLHFSL